MFAGDPGFLALFNLVNGSATHFAAPRLPTGDASEPEASDLAGEL
jgi:hypothetical protein